MVAAAAPRPNVPQTLYFWPSRPTSEWKCDILSVSRQNHLRELRLRGSLPPDAAMAVADLVRTHPALSTLSLAPDRVESGGWCWVLAAAAANPRIGCLRFVRASGSLKPSTASTLQSREAPLALELEDCDPCLPLPASAAGCGEYPCVRSLRLAQSGPGDPAPMARLLRAFPRLEGLVLEGMGAPETELPSGRPARPALTCISLRVERAPPHSLPGLLWRLSSLERLELASCALSSEEGLALAQCLRRGHVPHLRTCRLANCRSADGGVSDFVAALLSGCCPLEALDLAAVQGRWRRKPLAALGRNSTMQCFSAQDTSVFEDGSGAGDAFAGRTSLRGVTLAGAPTAEGEELPDQRGALLSNLLRGSPHLTALTAQELALSDSDAQRVAHALASGLPLTRLDLDGNSFSDEGVTALLGAAPAAAALTCLRLGGSVLSAQCVPQLAASLAASRSLRELDLGRTSWGALDAGAPLYAAACRHPALRCFLLQTGFSPASTARGRATLRQLALDNVTCRSPLPLAERGERERVLHARWPLRVGDAVALWHPDSHRVGVVEEAPRLDPGRGVLPALVRWPCGASTWVARWDLGACPRRGLDELWRLQDHFWSRPRCVAETALGCGGARQALRQFIPDEV